MFEGPAGNANEWERSLDLTDKLLNHLKAVEWKVRGEGIWWFSPLVNRAGVCSESVVSMNGGPPLNIFR